jgi:hypothetical protein
MNPADLDAYVRAAGDRNGPRGLILAPEPDPPARQIIAVVETPWRDERGTVWPDGSILVLTPEDYRKIRPLGVVRRFLAPRVFRGVAYRHALSLCGRLSGTREFVPIEQRPRGRPPKVAEYVPSTLPVAPFVAPRKGCGCGSRSPNA